MSGQDERAKAQEDAGGRLPPDARSEAVLCVVDVAARDHLGRVSQTRTIRAATDEDMAAFGWRKA